MHPAPPHPTLTPPRHPRTASPCTSTASPRSPAPSRRSSTPSHPSVATSACEPRVPLPPRPTGTEVLTRGAPSVALYEAMTRFVLPLCTHLPHRTAPTPVSSVTSIIDLAQVSLPALWALRAHLQEASALATANYPETLGTIAVVNSPAFFPTVWGWIKVRPPPPPPPPLRAACVARV